MTTRPAFLFAFISMSIVLVGSGHAQNTPKMSPADGTAGTNSPIIRSSGAISTNRSAHMSEASLDDAYNKQLGRMELALEQYRAGIDNLSVQQVREVWPGLDRRREAALKQAFAYLQSMSAKPKMGLECVAPTAIEPSTTLQCHESLTYNDAKGKPQHAKPARVSIVLKSQGDNWVVDTMK
jgi:hypothetical protein